MSILSYHNRISEEWGNNSLIFNFMNDEDFYDSGYRILQKMNNESLLKGKKIAWNGNIAMIYDVTDYITLETIMSGIDFSDFLKIVSGLLKCTISSHSMGLLQDDNFLLDSEKIFIDKSAMTPYLVYLPLRIESDTTSQLISMEEKIRQLLIYCLETFKNNETNAKATELKQDLQNRAGSLEDINKKVCEWIKPAMAKDIIVTSMLEEIHGEDRIIFSPDSVETVLGRDPKRAQKVIADSSISGRHCKIYCLNMEFYIKDLGSTNKTKVNGNILRPDIQYKLNENDLVTLAKKNYHFRLIYGGEHGKI